MAASRGFKIGIAVLAVIFLLMIGAEVLRRRLAARGAELRRQERRALLAEAELGGKRKNEQDCYGEAVARFKLCEDGFDGTVCRVEATQFMEVCFEQADPSPDLCDGVPPVPDTSKIDLTKLDEAKQNPPEWVLWRGERCRALGKEPVSCGASSFFQALQEHCDKTQ